VNWALGESVPAALTVATPIGLGCYVVYLAAGTYLRFQRTLEGAAD